MAPALGRRMGPRPGPHRRAARGDRRPVPGGGPNPRPDPAHLGRRRTRPAALGAAAPVRIVDLLQRGSERDTAPSSAEEDGAVRHCAPEGIRTPNLLIRSQMLYPLSYGRRGPRGPPTRIHATGRPPQPRSPPRGHHLAVGHQHRTWPGLPGGGATGPRAETVGFEPTEGVTPFTALAGPRTRPDYATSPRRASGYLSHSPPSKGPAAAHSRHCSYAHARSVSTRAAASPIAMQITTNTARTPDVTATWTSPLFSPTTVRQTAAPGTETVIRGICSRGATQAASSPTTRVATIVAACMATPASASCSRSTLATMPIAAAPSAIRMVELNIRANPSTPSALATSRSTISNQSGMAAGAIGSVDMPVAQLTAHTLNAAEIRMISA